MENRIRLHETALGSRVGRTGFYLPAKPANLLPSIGSTIDRFGAGEPLSHEERIRRTVEVTTLDAVVASEGRRLDLMKMDTEGSELDVLIGAERTIEASHPDIVMEITLDGNEPPEALSWLTRHDYRTFDLTPEGLTPVDVNALEDMHNLRRSANYLYGEVLASRKSDRAIATLCERIAALQWP